MRWKNSVLKSVENVETSQFRKLAMHTQAFQAQKSMHGKFNQNSLKHLCIKRY